MKIDEVPNLEVPLRGMVRNFLADLHDESMCVQIVQGYLDAAVNDATTLAEALNRKVVDFPEVALMAERVQKSMGRYRQAMEMFQARMAA